MARRLALLATVASRLWRSEPGDPNGLGGRTIGVIAMAECRAESVWSRLARTGVWHHVSIVMERADLASLMGRVRQGDDQAFAALYDEVAPAVFGTVKRVVRDPAMSEEVTQEVFVEVWRTAARFDEDRASVMTWVLTMARRRAVDRVRREQSQRDRIERAGNRRAEESVGPDDLVVASGDAARVGVALAELPDDQRVVIEMAFIDGDSHSVIAERLDLPLGTVKSRVRGGLRKLGARLGGEP